MKAYGALPRSQHKSEAAVIEESNVGNSQFGAHSLLGDNSFDKSVSTAITLPAPSIQRFRKYQRRLLNVSILGPERSTSRDVIPRIYPLA